MEDLSHRLELFCVVPWEVLYFLIGGNEVDLVLLTNNLAGEFGFIIFLADVSRLIIEQAVRVSHPRHTPEEDTTHMRVLINITRLTWSPRHHSFSL